jgi:hypothetical protein
MRFPQVIVCGPDDAANPLRQLVADRRWLLRECRQPAAALEHVRDLRPTVLVVQADPADERAERLRLVADAHRLNPDAAAVVLSDAKLPEAERAAWTAAVLDLGARYVLFPPLERPTLEELVGGLMAATIRRVMGPDAPAESVIDLADERYEDA